MLKHVLIVVLASSVGTNLFAQSHVHAQPLTSDTLPPGVIDGSAHPELIPDSTAFRLYLLVASELPNAPEGRKARQLAILRPLGLNDQELAAAISILAQFKQEYSNLIAQYNLEAGAAPADQPPDPKPFLAKRDALVQSTIGQLSSQLSGEAVTRLNLHIQREKARMRIAVTEAQ